MPLDPFALNDRARETYEQYLRATVNVREPRLAQFVNAELDRGLLWPDPYLQISPQFEKGATLAELASDGTIHQGTARFFGEDIRLHRHQEEALEHGLAGDSFAVATGTGSGKSLTYLLPIVDNIFRQHEADPSGSRYKLSALLIYPMNALINSQFEALEQYTEDYEANHGPCPVRFEKYTGQTSQDVRTRVINDPPPHPADQLHDVRPDPLAADGAAAGQSDDPEPADDGRRRVALLPRAPGRRRRDAPT